MKRKRTPVAYGRRTIATHRFPRGPFQLAGPGPFSWHCRLRAIDRCCVRHAYIAYSELCRHLAHTARNASTWLSLQFNSKNQHAVGKKRANQHTNMYVGSVNYLYIKFSVVLELFYFEILYNLYLINILFY